MARAFNYIPFLLLLFLSFAFLFHSDLSFNQDLGRHLKLGGIIWQTHQVPTTNLFSYTNPGFPFINHHWLFEVLVYLASITIGLDALLVLKLLFLLLIVTGGLLLARRTQSALFFAFGFIFVHMIRGRSELRPEILSFLFTVATLFILERFEKKNSKLIYFLPLLSLIWVNSHIYFPVGIFLQGIFLADLLFRKYVKKQTPAALTKKITTLSLVTAASILVSVINPNLLKGALYPFTVFGNYGVTITENQTVFTLQAIHFVNPDFFFFYLAVFMLLGAIYTSFWRTKFSLKHMLLVLLGLGLAFQSIRGFPYLFLISFPYVLLLCNVKASNIWIKGINSTLGALLIIESIMYLNGSYYALTYNQHTTQLTYAQDAQPAADFMVHHKLPQPIFNNFDIGSYLIYRGYPNYNVFIDGRPEAYPNAFFTRTYLPMQEEYKLFKKENQKYGFNTVIFSITDQNPRTLNFLSNITKDPQWKIVFLDKFMVILVKQDIPLSVVRLETLTPENYKYETADAYTNLSTFLANLHYYKQAKQMNQKALEISPDNPAANKIMAYILLFDTSNTSKATIQEYYNKSTSEIFW
jgi:hypothetical protein